MDNARRQAEDYAKALPVADGWPPFVLVMDVGHCIEVYADFSGQGKHYRQFPDRKGYRIYMEDLRKPEIRETLRLIWENPKSLDPTRQSAKVTRDVAARLAAVSKGLEARGHDAEGVALFLMRCLFTMFAEDVKLLPEECFTNWLGRARENKSKFKYELAQLWQAMDRGGYATVAETEVKRFNGKFFQSAAVLDLEREEIGELYVAAKANWKMVDPAIFGTLLEQALDKDERRRLGAHYTPRAYVHRLVVATIIEPLRQDWAEVQATTDRQVQEGKTDRALKTVRDFHHRLSSTRVLDPACGTGNFLYVALELMKELEGEVLEAMLALGSQEALTWLEGETVGPAQFLGLEKNARAAAIAELVVWLGYLQLHYKMAGQENHPPEPILHSFHNICHMDAVLTWDGYPLPKIAQVDGKSVETYPNARKPVWPEAEYIVGNPPFIGGKDIREKLGGAYTEALWKVHKEINNSADFVMYWWDRAAEILTLKGTVLRRFGFVTTNSITQVFSRRTVARYLEAKKPASIIMAIADHPWTKETRDAAAVRIAMTVVKGGKHKGVLLEVVSEEGLDTDEPVIELLRREGRVNSDLTVGVDVTCAKKLVSNEGICSPGVKLHGSGFIVTRDEALNLGLATSSDLKNYIVPYLNGRDLAARSRDVFVIDLYPLSPDEIRVKFPAVYQRVLELVKPERDNNNMPFRRDNWCWFGATHEMYRSFTKSVDRYIATPETAKHRWFTFLDKSIRADNMLVCVGSDDAYCLGVLSSKTHVTWALLSGGTLEDRPRYNKSRCFDPFPFPECSDDLKAKIRDVAEELDAHRKARQAAHESLTLTQMYNVLEKLRAGEPLDEKDEQIKADGLILILKELHDKLDALVFEAYGWSADLTDDEILEKLVALNQKRALEEKVGIVKWLRPEYQIPRFGSDVEKERIKHERETARADQTALALDDDLQEMKPRYPTDKELEETAAVMRVLAMRAGPLSSEEIAREFKQGKQVQDRVKATLAALSRMGHLEITEGGERFSLR